MPATGGGLVAATSNGCSAKSSNKRFRSAAFKADFVKTFGTVHAMFVKLRTNTITDGSGGNGGSVTSSSMYAGIAGTGSGPDGTVYTSLDSCGYTPQATCCACIDTYVTCMSGCKFIKTGFYTSACKVDVSLLHLAWHRAA